MYYIYLSGLGDFFYYFAILCNNLAPWSLKLHKNKISLEVMLFIFQFLYPSTLFKFRVFKISFRI